MLQDELVVQRAVLRHQEDVRRARIHVEVVPESDGSGELHLGTQDLVRVAGFAMENGFRLVRLSLADPFLTPLDPEQEAEASELMVGIITRYGARELESALNDEFDGLYVTAVELISIHTGLRVIVRRRGYVDTSTPEEAEGLLNSAWKALNLT